MHLPKLVEMSDEEKIIWIILTFAFDAQIQMLMLGGFERAWSMIS